MDEIRVDAVKQDVDEVKDGGLIADAAELIPDEHREGAEELVAERVGAVPARATSVKSSDRYPTGSTRMNSSTDAPQGSDERQPRPPCASRRIRQAR